MEGREVVVVVWEVFQRVLVRVETSLVEEADIIYVRLSRKVNAILIIAVVNFMKRLIMKVMFERCKMLECINVMVSDWYLMMLYNMGLMVSMGLLVNIMRLCVWMMFHNGVLFHVRVLLDNSLMLDDMNGLDMTFLNHSIGSVFIVVMLSDRC